MAEKLIKQFTIGSDTGKIDYENGIGGNKPDVASITPKKVTISWEDANIKSACSYKYYSSATVYDKDPVALAAAGSVLYARDGDFGYPCIDGTGQVNIGVELQGAGYDTLIPVATPTGSYNTFKTPYTTCVDNLYRFTKVTSNVGIKLAAGKESEMEAYGVTYNLVLPEGYEGLLPTVTEFRTNDAMLASYKGTAVAFTEGTSVGHKTYSKDTGYPDKSFTSATEGDAAQVNFSVVGTLPEGYTMSVAVSPKKYKNLKVSTDKTQYQLTKVYGDETITITIAPPVSVTYETTEPTEGQEKYVWSTSESEIPSSVGMGSPLTFAFYHQTNKQNPTTDTTCKPDGTGCGGSGAAPTPTACLSRISSCTIGGTAFTITADMITVSGKKATVTIPGANITGNVVIKLGVYSAA